MDPVYLDNAATTPIREEVLAAMEPFASRTFGNPSSIHRWGRAAHAALEDARAEAAFAIGAKASEIYFVRGGTESDNIAVLGWCQAQMTNGETPTIAFSALEHHAVLEAAESARRDGKARAVKLPVTLDGKLDPDLLRSAVTGRPALVSVMWVNNETGMVLPVREVAQAVAEAGGTMHTDAAQAIGKVPIDVREVSVHMLSATGHKLHGPKGIGILYVREGTDVAPLIHGGGQERRMRPGTEDVAGAVGLALAMRLATTELERESARLQGFRDTLGRDLLGAIPGSRINAGVSQRAPHVLSVGIAGLKDGAALVMALDLEGVAVSGGSACSSGATKRSHVMSALYGENDDHASVRFSFGRSTTANDIRRAREATERVVAEMKRA
jgi:cysteine desulfurase